MVDSGPKFNPRGNLTTQIRRATGADASRFAEASERFFRDAFGSTNDPVQIDAYCATHFGEPYQRAELADAGRVTTVVERAGEILGYATLRAFSKPNTVLPCATPLEIERFYVHHAHHGSGLAHKLMQHCIEAAAALGADALWLGVWQQSPRAIAFYRKFGFEVVGEQTFMLGSETQWDYVMARDVARE